MARPSLDDIFSEQDEFGLLELKQRAGRGGSKTTPDVEVLLGVTHFVEAHGRMPDEDAPDHEEMKLATTWGAIKASPTEAMRAADRLGLLDTKPEVSLPSWKDEPVAEAVPESLDDIFADDDLDVDASLFAFEHTTPAVERVVSDHRADCVPCRDFEQFRERFETIQRELETGQRKVRFIKERTVIDPIEGDVFIRNGLLAMIAEKPEMTARGGSRDHRLRVVFSNGTESNPLMTSFRKSLWEDKTARTVQKRGLGRMDPKWEDDQLQLSGTIYVARSCSKEPTIREQRMFLHKIGVTSQDVARRVVDARNDPTFLLAPVEIVATYSLKNLSRHKIENLLHRFFAAARPAELFIIDRFGKKVSPKEWFYVLPEHVRQAVKLIEEGTLHLFRYDVKTQKIVNK